MILEGYGNMALESLGLLSDEKKAMAQARMIKCVKCPLKDGDMCSKNKSMIDKGQFVSGCGCHIPAAATVEEKECPRGLW